MTYWRKNLYEKSDLPDNYTDDTFLKHLRRNIKYNKTSLRDAINFSASISIHFSIVVFFAITYIWLYNEWITPSIVLICNIILTVLGYLVYSLEFGDISTKLPEDLRTALVFLVFGYILSPVLKTLTETISTDTIYAMAILMFLIHLIFNKYGSLQLSLSDSLSITSSIFGSLMLASRLASPLYAFSLLTVSVQSFVLLPMLFCCVNNMIIMSIGLIIKTVYLLFPISHICSYAFLIVTIFIHCICPLWFIRCQQFKNNIYGPWDEAVIK